MAVFR